MNIRDDFVLKEINEGYLVGGSIRDLFTKHCVFCDRDISIKGAENFARKIANKWDGTFIELDSENKIYRVVLPDKINFLDISELQGNTIEEDLKRRDFTINAMAKRTTDGEIIDIFGGIDDIKSKKLRVLHDKSFEDDPTRILRALKFSLRFGFTLDESTARFQKEYLKNINYDMSYHRLKKELVETFNLNSQEAYDRFTSEGIYKLLGKSVLLPECHPDFRNLNYSGRHIWLIYLSFFNLENLELTRAEKRIIEWAERLKTEKQTNNTPIESIIINEIYKEAVS